MQGWAARNAPFVAALLLFVYIVQVVHAIRGQSLTWDEGDHIFAGYSQWKTHDYGLNPEHPPMVKMVATLPLLSLPLKVPQLQGRDFKLEAYLDGRELLFRNGAASGGHYEARDLTLRVRLFAMVFGLFGALVVFCTAREMFSPLAGLAALAVFVFDPTVLAHSAYVTTDMAASGTMLATVYCFWRWSQRPTLGRLAVTGVAAGFSLAAKHSTVLLVPMLVTLAVVVVIERVQSYPANRMKAAMSESLRVAASLCGVAAVALLVLWAWYGFHYAARPAGLALDPTLADYVKPLAPAEAKGILLLARFHVLPESYLYGLTDVRRMANGMPSYFFGHVYAHGVWQYFPVLITIKMTLAMLVVLALSVFAMARGWLRDRTQLLFLILPMAIYFIVAMTSHLNIGARHVLPVYVFGCVLCGATLVALSEHGRAWRAVAAVLLLFHVGTSIASSPNYMAYANEAWGGPRNTYKYLSDSNTDWAQQLVAVADYTRSHNIHQCWFAYFADPMLLPQDYGVPCKSLNTIDTLWAGTAYVVPPHIDGPVFISAGTLNAFEFGSSALSPYKIFEKTKPTDFIQDGVFVYNGSFDVSLDSAMGHVVAAMSLLAKKNTAAAVAEAQLGAQTAPGEVWPEVTYGDALAAAHRDAEARQAYERALPKIATMDPDAREEWESKVKEKVARLQ
ncbi:Dolichyl-phosphate-mannose-protein mannosyltransferase [Bryocella elongata]|uniref:Dolichyl-phosphate-mannose-protein mannosyltransferase n=1 Tax=Bryocella elongata TaxID=863522 RepID=A0A1H6A7I3_9BACT|nr:glycosyltransferase family 39 protein [Bryocella elongata]SEG44698.1 Dolichyl-phosphate-mannose-protein mannosyltransferase [Bryocella elongata]